MSYSPELMLHVTVEDGRGFEPGMLLEMTGHEGTFEIMSREDDKLWLRRVEDADE